MSLHTPEKHLAALVSVVEEDLSIRAAARLHGVNRNSVWAWVHAHHSGKETIEMLRAGGVCPAAPVAPLEAAARADGEVARRRARLLDDFAAWRRRGEELREHLTEERETLNEQSTKIAGALQEVETLLGERPARRGRRTG